MLVDESWSFFGSTNWDPRSLRLNFELNVETYDAELAGRLTELFELKRSSATPLLESELDRIAFPARLRNALARLLTPYL
jgi:cardiolipin synthase